MGTMHDDLERNFGEMFANAPDPGGLLDTVVEVAREAAKAALLATGGHAVVTVTARNADVTEYWVIETDEAIDHDAALAAVIAGDASLLYDTVDDNEEDRDVTEVEGP